MCRLECHEVRTENVGTKQRFGFNRHRSATSVKPPFYGIDQTATRAVSPAKTLPSYGLPAVLRSGCRKIPVEEDEALGNDCAEPVVVQLWQYGAESGGREKNIRRLSTAWPTPTPEARKGLGIGD